MTQNPHIFIVDDEAPAREMVGDYLKMHGFGVTLCDGGKSLRKEIESNVPDLVVLDLNMPEEDGLSIIRDLKSKIDVPVIMLTATASPIDRVVGLELGADDYIAKPCELRELMARIRSVLRRSTPAKAAAAPQPAAAKAEPAKPASAPRPTPRRDPARVASAPAPASSGAAVRRLAAGESRHSNIARGKAMAEQRRLDSERRRLEAERHRQAVAQRNAERDRRRPPAAGLPVPEAASAAR